MFLVSLVLKILMHNTGCFNLDYRRKEKELWEIIIFINQKLGAHK